jgi:hypothetical protein
MKYSTYCESNALKDFQATETTNTPSSGLSATFSPFEGEKGLPEILRKHDDKSLTALV